MKFMDIFESFRDAVILWLMVCAFIILVICIGLFGASLAKADMICVPVGQYLTCFHQGGQQTIQTPLGPNYGAVIGPQGTTPYAILPAPSVTPTPAPSVTPTPAPSVTPTPAPLIILPPPLPGF